MGVESDPDRLVCCCRGHGGPLAGPGLKLGFWNRHKRYLGTSRFSSSKKSCVFFEDARRGFDAFLGQLWHGADQMRPDVRVIMTLNIMTLILVS